MHDRMSEKKSCQRKENDLKAENILGMKYRVRKMCLGGEKTQKY